MKNILIVKGQSQYNAGRNYLDEMAEECLNLGYNVLTLDGIDIKERCRRLLAEYKEQIPFDLLITYSLQVPRRMRGDIPAECTYLCDHPSVHEGRLREADEDTLVCVVDGDHEKYIHRYIKNIKHTCFLPLGGSYGQELIPYGKRTREVLKAEEVKDAFFRLLF